MEDTEIVHAVAPCAAIRVILIKRGSSAGSLVAAPDADAGLRLALMQGAVVSISSSVGEHCFTPAEVADQNAALQAAADHHVTVVGSSGDYGAVGKPCPGAGAGFTPVKEVGLLASNPLALAAGGTSLDANRATGAYVSETAWNTPPGPSNANSGASGGGFSHLFPRPAYQDGVPGIGAARGVPDVAADADPSTGMALAATDGPGKYVLYPASGTSAAAPLWAALIALADQYAGRDLGFINPVIYRIGRSAYYHQAFHDITTGDNTEMFPPETITGYQASPGWDPVTGWGSPNAQALIPLLARYTAP